MAAAAKVELDVEALPGTDAYRKESERIMEEERLAKLGDSPEPETKAETEPEPEPEAEAEPEADAEEKPDPIMIPKARFDEVLADARELRKELSEMRGEMRARLETKDKEDAEPPMDLEAADRERWEAIENGDFEKARDLEASIEQEKEKRLSEKMSERFEQMQAHTGRQTAAQSAADRVYAKYPQLRAGGEGYNREAAEWAERYVSGMSQMPDADVGAVIEEAGELAAMRFALTGTETGLADAAAGKPSRAETSYQQAREKAELARRQPPDVQGLGRSAGERSVGMSDILRMTDEEFASISPTKLSEMRGDYLREAS